MCADERCFAPEDAEQPYDPESNICPYLSSPGTMQGAVNEASRLKRVLRASGDHKGKTADALVSELINTAFGPELRKYCHFGKEACIITLLVKELCSMTVDLRPLLGGLEVYHTAKHIRKLGLQRVVPGLERSTHTSPDTFLKPFSWKGSPGSPPQSDGMGVNMWALLLMGSLIGNDELHTKNSSKVATSLLTLMLGMAPAASTPGKRIPVRSFNQRSGTPETVIVSATGQPEHFLRPINDDKFAMQGEFSYCPQDEGRMPEDYLGCAHVQAMAKFIKCKYTEVPPQHLRGFYQLMQKRHYALSRKAHPKPGVKDARGNLYIDHSGAVITWVDSEGRTGTHRTSMTEWEPYLQTQGFLVMPMVWRRGAAVEVDSPAHGVGCLVMQPVHLLLEHIQIGLASTPYTGNYDPVNHGYHVQTTHDTPLLMGFESTLERLIEPGRVMWLRPGSQTWKKLQPHFPGGRRAEDDTRMVRVRLNVPHEQQPADGKLCVTILERRAHASQVQDCSYRHMLVDPWELTLEREEGVGEIKELLV